jgi:hypothetical protein
MVLFFHRFVPLATRGLQRNVMRQMMTVSPMISVKINNATFQLLTQSLGISSAKELSAEIECSNEDLQLDYLLPFTDRSLLDPKERVHSVKDI